MVKYLRTKQFVRIKQNFGIHRIRNRQITLYTNKLTKVKSVRRQFSKLLWRKLQYSNTVEAFIDFAPHLSKISGTLFWEKSEANGVHLNVTTILRHLRNLFAFNSSHTPTFCLVQFKCIQAPNWMGPDVWVNMRVLVSHPSQMPYGHLLYSIKQSSSVIRLR